MLLQYVSVRELFFGAKKNMAASTGLVWLVVCILFSIVPLLFYSFSNEQAVMQKQFRMMRYNSKTEEEDEEEEEKEEKKKKEKERLFSFFLTRRNLSILH